MTITECGAEEVMLHCVPLETLFWWLSNKYYLRITFPEGKSSPKIPTYSLFPSDIHPHYLSKSVLITELNEFILSGTYACQIWLLFSLIPYSSKSSVTFIWVTLFVNWYDAMSSIIIYNTLYVKPCCLCIKYWVYKVAKTISWLYKQMTETAHCVIHITKLITSNLKDLACSKDTTNKQVTCLNNSFSSQFKGLI